MIGGSLEWKCFVACLFLDVSVPVRNGIVFNATFREGQDEPNVRVKLGRAA